jgi:hypothetical protein
MYPSQLCIINCHNHWTPSHIFPGVAEVLAERCALITVGGYSLKDWYCSSIDVAGGRLSLKPTLHIHFGISFTMMGHSTPAKDVRCSLHGIQRGKSILFTHHKKTYSQIWATVDRTRSSPTGDRAESWISFM